MDNKTLDAIKAYKQILKQAGRLVVDISGLIAIGEILKEHITPELFNKLMQNEESKNV